MQIRFSLIFILCPTPISCLSPQLNKQKLSSRVCCSELTQRISPLPLIWRCLIPPLQPASFCGKCSLTLSRWRVYTSFARGRGTGKQLPLCTSKSVCGVLCCCVNTWSSYSLWILASTVNYFCIENWKNGMYLLTCAEICTDRCKGA